MRPIPMIPTLKDGELAMTLSWGYSPHDLDLHVEFAGGRTILCKSDFAMKICGGVHSMNDEVQGGNKGADVIKFDWVGDFHYMVYVSVFKHKEGPRSGTTEPDVSLADSQA